MRRLHQGTQSARAVALDHGARSLDRQTRDESCVPRNAAAVFTRLIGATHNKVLDLFRLER
ncbi:hypothetical protein D3C83_91790 [compost metagenome]